jgi:acyl-CoA hydrolase
VRQGRTSVQYRATVSRVGAETGADMPIFSTNITFVRVDDHGQKTPLPPWDGAAVPHPPAAAT